MEKIIVGVLLVIYCIYRYSGAVVSQRVVVGSTVFSLTLNIYSVQNSCLQCDLCADTPLRSQVRFLKGVPPTLASDLGISGPDAESAKGKSISLFSVTAVRFPLGETLDLHRSSGASVASSSRLWCTGIKLPGCT